MFNDVANFIQEIYGTEDFIPLHEPIFEQIDKDFVVDCIDSTFVSSVGKYVTQFEDEICKITGAKYAIACMNGTAALHLSLVGADVEPGDEVITQALTFVATANAIKYCGAEPIFIDSDSNNLGMSPSSLEEFLIKNIRIGEDGFSYNKNTGARVKACVPMHVFGNPVLIDSIVDICNKYNLILIEDCAESLGSYYGDMHTGLKSKMGVLSFNGNKIITCGGGGIVFTNDENLAKKLKHLSTTAKVSHKWNFVHDEVGYNYRMPNLNAALGCAQLTRLDNYLSRKQNLFTLYKNYFDTRDDLSLLGSEVDCRSNFWLQAVELKDKEQRDEFLETLNNAGVMSRPIWKLIPDLEPYRNSQTSSLENAKRFEDTVVNIPSSCNYKK